LYPFYSNFSQLIMANLSDEEADSRTALVGAPRTRSNPRSTSRSASHDSTRPAKRQRRNRNKKDSDLADFVPKGVAFTATSLPVDPDSTSSSGSSSSSSEDSDSDSDADPSTTANPHAGNTAPAISWNQGRKAAVRTTLGKRSAPTNENPTQFEAVNDKYWRSRSESVASANGEEKPTANDHSENDGELEDGEIDSKSDTDDSDLGSEADDSILLNIGDKMGMDGANDYDPATLAHQHASNTGNPNLKSISTQSGPGSKEEAFRLFSIKYPSAPTALVDLSQTDLESLAKYVYFDRSIHDLDLRLPISCLECQSEGHMADVCPAKEVCSILHPVTLFPPY
jgi:protein AIR1/2